MASFGNVSVRELLHFIFEAGSVVYNWNLQDRIVSIKRLKHLKGFQWCKSKSYASQNRLRKSWIERHWNIWKRSLIQTLLRC